jgi:hypothetical protein
MGSNLLADGLVVGMEVVSGWKGLLQRSHSKIARLGELRTLLSGLRCYNTSIYKIVLLKDVLFIGLWKISIAGDPPLHHDLGVILLIGIFFSFLLGAILLVGGLGRAKNWRVLEARKRRIENTGALGDCGGSIFSFLSCVLARLELVLDLLPVLQVVQQSLHGRYRPIEHENLVTQSEHFLYFKVARVC